MSVAFAAKLRIHLSVSPQRLASPALGAGILMLLVYMLVRSVPVLLAVPAGIVVFGIVLISSGGISREDLHYLRERLV